MMDWQGLWQLLQPYIAGRVRHLLVAAATVLVTRHIIQGDQVSAFVDIGMSIAAYLAAEVWSIVAARAVPWLQAEKKRLEGLLGKRAELAAALARQGQAAQAQPLTPPAQKP